MKDRYLRSTGSLTVGIGGMFPVSGVDKKDTIWSDPTSAPPNPMIKDIITALDEDFSKLSLTPSIKAPKYRNEYSLSTHVTLRTMPTLSSTFIE